MFAKKDLFNSIIKLKDIISNNYLFPILLFFTTLVIYVKNISPSIYGVDSGDLLSAALTKGVAHPSGYPTYTMLAILFLKLPINASPAWKVGLSSAIFSSLSLVIFYLIVDKLLKHKAIALITSFIVAFSYSYWIYAEVVEIFTLHNFFIFLLIYLALTISEKPTEKKLYSFVFIIGLSLTNNLSIILLYPLLFLFFFFNKKFFAFLTFRKIFISFAFLLLGLTPYLYIPLAASRDPYINWDRAVNLNNLLHLVLRRDYGWGVDKNTLRSTINSQNSSNSFKVYYFYWKYLLAASLPILALLGLAYGYFKKNRKFVLFAFFSALTLGPILLMHARIKTSFLYISIAERFILTSILMVLLLVPFGMKYILYLINKNKIVKNLKNILTTTSIITFTLIPISSYIANKEKTKLENVHIYDYLAKDILDSLPENSYLFFFTDTYAFPVLYYQTAYNYREDIIISGKNTGYEKFLHNSDVMDDSNIKAHLTKYQNSTTKANVQNGIKNLLDNNENVFTEKRIVFENENLGRIETVPYGLLYKFIKEEDRPNISKFENNYVPIYKQLNLKQFTQTKNEYIISENFNYTSVKIRYAKALLNAEEYLLTNYEEKNYSSSFRQLAESVYPKIDKIEIF